MKKTYLPIAFLSIMAALFLFSCKKATVNSPVTIVLQPSHNTAEGHVDDYINTAGPDTSLEIESWTISGTPVNWRTYIKFDQSGIPSSASITSAKLYLYGQTHPAGGNTTDDNYGTANAYHIRRVTASWALSTMTWSGQPTNTTTDEIIMPQTNQSIESDTVDVTSLVSAMQVNGNYGFEMGLENETHYNIRQYASSYTYNPAHYPKLVITYQP
jgi:hypothetical protein